MGLLDRIRRITSAPPRRAPVVHTGVLGDDVRWSRPFHWGLLIAHDADAQWEVPRGAGKGAVAATASCLALSVRHSRDVVLYDDGDTEAPLPPPEVEVVLTTRPLETVPDYDGPLRCPTGRLQVGDADAHHLVQVPPGQLRVQVWLDPEEHAERVVIAVRRAG